MFAGSVSNGCGICLLITLADSVLDGTQKINDVGDIGAVVFLGLETNRCDIIPRDTIGRGTMEELEHTGLE